MPELKTAKLFIKKSPKTKDRFNKNLLKFFTNNVKEIIDSGIFIRIILVDKSNLSKFISLGIKMTPALMFEDSIITGVDNIIKYFIDYCEQPNTQPTAKKVLSCAVKKQDNGDIRDYQLECLLKDDDGFEDELDLNSVKDYEEKRRKLLDKTNNKNVSANKNTINAMKQNTSFSNNSIDNSDSRNYINEKDQETPSGNISELVDDEDDAIKKYWANLEETE